MSELQKIAADMRDHAVITGKHGNEVLQRIIESWADALDALAAQSEPVAWQDTAKHDVLVTHDALDPIWKPMMRPLYAAPQPAPPQPAVPEEFERALDDMICRLSGFECGNG